MMSEQSFARPGSSSEQESLSGTASAGAGKPSEGMPPSYNQYLGSRISGSPIFMEVSRMLCFIVGFFIGGIAGFCTAALVIATYDRSDDHGEWS